MLSLVKLLKIDNFTSCAYTKLSRLLHFGIKSQQSGNVAISKFYKK